MSRRTSGQIVAAIDIGTTKSACLIGQITDSGLKVIGVGQAPHKGVRQGLIVNIEGVSQAITKAKDEAELMAGEEIHSVWLGVSGSHIRSFSSDGMVAIKNKEVAENDVERVIEAACAVAIPSDRQVMHVVPNEYKIDDQKGIRDPIGMSGVRLEASVHIITASQSAVQNMMKCCESVGLKVEGLVLQQLASAVAVANEDEKNMGVVVADIGGGTCDLITYIQGSVAHTAMIPVGGQNFTQDISIGLKTTQAAAEELKKHFGCVFNEMIDPNETIEVESVSGRKSRTLKRSDLTEVLSARAEETLNLIRRQIDDQGHTEQIGSGLVLTGGGSHLDGLISMAEFELDFPVRRGLPENVSGLAEIVKSAQYATGVGLLIYGYEQRMKSRTPESVATNEGSFFLGIRRRLNELFCE